MKVFWRIIAILALMLQISCMDLVDERLINMLRHNVGKPIDLLVMEIGAPAYKIQTNTGHYYTWVKETRAPERVYGYHYKDPFVNIFANSENLYEEETPEMAYECKLTIGTNNDDIIISYHISGKCDRRNTFLE